MDYSNISLFALMRTKLDYLSQRQSVLAQNIANADTPGYKAQDIATPNFQAMADAATGAGKLKMAVTSPRHLQPDSGGAGAFKIENRKSTDELNPNGNNVVIEEEMSKVAQNQADYQQALSLYGKMITMFKTAIGNPNNGG